MPRSSTCCLLPLLLLACGEAPPPAVSAQVSAIHENQGTGLLSTSRPLFSIAYAGARGAAGRPFTGVAVQKGYLEFSAGGATFGRADGRIVGARLVGPLGAEAVILRACPHARPPAGWRPPLGWTPPPGCAYPPDWEVQPDEFEYEVAVDDGGGGREPLCSGAWNRAVPIAGIYEIGGAFQPSATHFSFACNSGVVVKCSNWGYKPWLYGDHHQACTRMARADYCGTGESHTFEGTPIDVYDSAHVNLPASSPDAFEAAWLPRGALCLSRTRWQALPIDGYCRALLPDPRFGGGRYCEDMTPKEMEDAGAIVFNHAGRYERGLYSWYAVGGADRLTTSSGYSGGAGGDEPPLPGYAPRQFEGVVFRLPLTGTVPLRTYRDPSSGDSLTTTGAAPAGYREVPGDEGYLYPAGGALPPTAVPLTLYRHAVNGDYLTAVAPGPGYEAVRLEGYLPARP